jgi:EAL domain-containing protein (putative c-di-GMP-specific phosphodiesterase class I)
LLAIAGSSGPAQLSNCAINLRREFGDDDFVEYGGNSISTGPRQVCFQITETSAISNSQRQVHQALKKLGCRFA